MGHRHFLWLLFFASLFGLRVLAQLVQAIHPVSWLPPFQAWHGAVLSYPVLVVLQVGIMVALMSVFWSVRRRDIAPRPWKYQVCFVLGGLYFVAMAFRLFAGLTFLADHPWFSKSLPAFFYAVLATFMLTLGHYLYGQTTTPTPRAGGLDPIPQRQSD